MGRFLETYSNMSTDDSLSVPSQRKPLTGRLALRIHSVADVDHASTGRFARGPETFVIMKVEDVFKGRTKATRTDKWTDEIHEFDIDKANEIELTVYDKAGDHPLPIGMLWIRISDIAEEMRRKRIETEFNQAGWVSADKMDSGSPNRPDLQFQPPPGSTFSPTGPGGAGAGMGPQPGAGQAAPQTGPIYISAWFSLEPVGRIQLTLSFSKIFKTTMTDTEQLTASRQNEQGAPRSKLRNTTCRCYPPAQRRGSRTVWPQIRPTAILQHYALCALWRFFKVCGRHAMCRLQIHLPQELLSKSCHKVY